MHAIPCTPFLANIAPKAIVFASKHLTNEGLYTIIALLVVSIFSWTVIISKARQLLRARKMATKFFAEYRATRDPLEIFRNQKEFEGAPAYELYRTGAEEVAYHLKNNPVQIAEVRSVLAGSNGPSALAETDMLARSISTKISRASFDSVQVALDSAA